MTLILGNEDVDDLLTMDDVIAALEPAYRNIAEGRAVVGGRADLVSETPYDPDARYWLKMASGIVPDLEVGTIRINSDIVTWPKDGNGLRRVKAPLAPGKRWVGLVLLFSSATGEPLAIFPDGAIQRLRVAGSTGLSIKHMAREDSEILGLLGSGWQAGAHLEAACAVRPIKRVNVFSPTPGHGEKFAGVMSARRGVEVVAAETPEDAVKGADIVVTATNSMNNVFFADWVEPGMHLATIRDGEFETAVLSRVDLLAIHDPGNMGDDHIHAPPSLTIPDLGKEIAGVEGFDEILKAPTLAQVVAGRAPARENADQVTCFLNYHGLGFQFTATGAAFYAKAVKAGRGHELPTEWFTEDVHP
ncbi:MAG: ornithine cyclodeaminase family protein [Alphaproteobacteria bacterium]|nr:ornithine cyclodeaminase family protein [Alphaproteobacteria bacterium]MCZ6742306.1 ornithine cyclodeaminase family protein [Alphaproteobacteria bacterium]